MVNKHEDWIDALREAATQDGGELPEGLWERISASLDAVPPSSGAFPPHPMRRRRFHVRAASAAAAAVILAAGIFMLVTLTKGFDEIVVTQAEIQAESEIPAGNNVAGITEPEQVAEDGIAVGHTAEAQDAETVLRAVSAATRREPAKPEQGGGDIAAVTEPADISESATVAGSSAATESAEDAEPETTVIGGSGTEAEKGERKKDASPADIGTLPRRGHSRIAAIGKQSSRRGMLALSASGISSTSHVSPQNTIMSMQTAVLTPNRDGFMVMNARPPQYSYRHRQPLTFAVSMDFNVGRNLYAGTGVSYTRLSSTAVDAASGAEFDQLLQYVGIPATFKWAFLNTNIFMLYAGAEAQAEFCVGARFDGRRVDVRTMQWSLHALAGAQLNLGRHVGIYVEPKLSHYFIDTELATVRNTRGVNFNLQLGLRFSY